MKKKNIWLHFLKMLFLFLIIFALQQVLGAWLTNNFVSLKYGKDLLFEAVWAGLVLIVLLLFKNSYVFTQERETYKSSLKFGIPEFVLSGIFLLISIVSIVSEKISISTVLNLVIYCFFIGVVEEFLCRGWLLNEFLERFSDTKKGIIKSIVLSSLVFGAIHFTNMLGGQNFAETLVQVINACVSGVFLALVYYKTKNIWAVVTLHAVWDFSLMLMQLHTVIDCVPGNSTTSIIIFNIIQSIVLIIAYLLFCYWIYAKTDLNDNKDIMKKGWYSFLPIAGVILYLFGLFFISSPDMENYYTCPVYENKLLGEEITFTTDNYKNYTLEFDDNKVDEYTNQEISDHYKLELYLDNMKLYIKIDDNKVMLTDKYPTNYLLISNEDDFEIIIQKEYNKVLFGRFNKSDIVNDSKYLESIKDELTEYITPDLDNLGYIVVKNSNYKYAALKTDLNKLLYFDKNKELVFNEK